MNFLSDLILGERWAPRLVATAAEDRLNICAHPYTSFAASSVTPRVRVLTNAQIAAPAFLGHNHRLSIKRQMVSKKLQSCGR